MSRSRRRCEEDDDADDGPTPRARAQAVSAAARARARTEFATARAQAQAASALARARAETEAAAARTRAQLALAAARARARPAAQDEVERAFLDRLEAEPRDDESRSVYADWLEEHSRLEEAELIRVQLQLKSLGAEDPRLGILGARLRELASKVDPAWRRSIARPAIEGCDVRFELLCPKSWDSLAPTSAPDVRFCGACRKDVHYATSIEEAREHAFRGECVAVDVSLRREPRDLDPRGRLMFVGRIAPSAGPRAAPPTRAGGPRGGGGGARRGSGDGPGGGVVVCVRG